MRRLVVLVVGLTLVIGSVALTADGATFIGTLCTQAWGILCVIQQLSSAPCFSCWPAPSP